MQVATFMRERSAEWLATEKWRQLNLHTGCTKLSGATQHWEKRCDYKNEDTPLRHWIVSQFKAKGSFLEFIKTLALRCAAGGFHPVYHLRTGQTAWATDKLLMFTRMSGISLITPPTPQPHQEEEWQKRVTRKAMWVPKGALWCMNKCS